MYSFTISFYYFTPYWLLALIIVGAPVLLGFFAGKLRKYSFMKRVWLIAAIGYGFFILWYTVLRRVDFSLPVSGWINYGSREVYLLPFEVIRRSRDIDETIRGYIMNLLLFEPLGVFVCLHGCFTKSTGRAAFKASLRALVAGFGLSLIAEALQYIFGVGLAEADDLIFNTLGAFVGGALSALFYCPIYSPDCKICKKRVHP